MLEWHEQVQGLRLQLALQLIKDEADPGLAHTHFPGWLKLLQNVSLICSILHILSLKTLPLLPGVLEEVDGIFNTLSTIISCQDKGWVVEFLCSSLPCFD